MHLGCHHLGRNWWNNAGDPGSACWSWILNIEFSHSPIICASFYVVMYLNSVKRVREIKCFDRSAHRHFFNTSIPFFLGRKPIKKIKVLFLTTTDSEAYLFRRKKKKQAALRRLRGEAAKRGEIIHSAKRITHLDCESESESESDAVIPFKFHGLTVEPA